LSLVGCVSTGKRYIKVLRLVAPVVSRILMKTNAACGSDEVELLEKQFPEPEPRKELSPESLRALLS
jgi:hypothetical protein